MSAADGGSEATAARRAFAARLRAREQLTGLIVKMPCASLLETAGYSGFDFAVIDTEHGPGDGEMLEHHVRAADSAGLPVLVRVAGTAAGEILHALDAGAAGIVAPHVRDAAACEAVVRSAHYPPRGSRGLATSTRAGFHGTTSVAEHLRHASESTVVIAQLEHGEAVEHAAAIAAVPQLDAVFIGPSDLSISLGHPGERDHPAVRDAIERASAAVLGPGEAALCMLADDEPAARAARAAGATLVVFAAPQLIAARLGSLVAALRASGPEVAERTLEVRG